MCHILCHYRRTCLTHAHVSPKAPVCAPAPASVAFDPFTGSAPMNFSTPNDGRGAEPPPVFDPFSDPAPITAGHCCAAESLCPFFLSTYQFFCLQNLLPKSVLLPTFNLLWYAQVTSRKPSTLSTRPPLQQRIPVAVSEDWLEGFFPRADC